MKNVKLAMWVLLVGMPGFALAEDTGGTRGPVLYDPSEKTAPARTAPERTLRRHELGDSGVVLVAGEIPAAPLPFDDMPRREMFRVYFTR